MTAPRVIRSAGAGDLGAILGLYRHLNPDDPRLDHAAAGPIWARMLADEHLRIFLVECNGEPIATCMLILTDNLTRGGRPFGTIENVVTHAAHRGQGHGQAVLRAACTAAWDAGAYKVMLMTGSNLDSTLHFYEAAGFRRAKTAFEIRRMTAQQE